MSVAAPGIVAQRFVEAGGIAYLAKSESESPQPWWWSVLASEVALIRAVTTSKAHPEAVVQAVSEMSDPAAPKKRAAPT